MFLTLDQIKAFTSGAVSVEKEDGIIRFKRMTVAQEEAFREAAPHLYVNTLSTTGITIDFHTDSAALTLQTGGPGKYEVLINDQPRFQFLCKEAKACCMDLEPGEKKITIVLPCHSVGTIANIRLNLGSRVWAHSYDKKLLFAGDSITQGWQSKWDCLTYTHLVARYYNADAMNWGVGGTCFYPKTFQDVSFDADAVIVAYGTNDFNACRSMEHFRENCQGYLANVKAVYPDKPVFCLTPLWRAEQNMIRKVGTLHDIRAALTEIANSFGFTVIDGLKLMPHVPEFYADERLHPNDLGFSVYAQSLIRELNQYL